MPFLNNAIVEFLDDTDKVKLAEVLYYVRSKTNEEFRIPRGFLSDGASIPRVLWTAVGSPFTGEYVDAAILHDFLYQNPGERSRAEIDQIFLEAMKDHGVGYFKRYTIYWGVRSGGWVAWNNHRSRDGKKLS